MGSSPALVLEGGCEAVPTGHFDKVGCEEPPRQASVNAACSQVLPCGHQLCVRLTAPAPGLVGLCLPAAVFSFVWLLQE